MSSDEAAVVEAPGETELKFDVTREALQKLAGHPAMATAPTTKRLLATYYDTKDLALRRAGLSLRVRQEGERFVQTAKRATGPAMFRREEWEAETASTALDLAALGNTPILQLLEDDPTQLVPIFVSDVDRKTRVWTDGASTIELTIDEGRLVAGETEAPVLEMELELKAGDPAALYALARSLFDAAPIRLSLLTKSDRGFALADGDSAPAAKAAAAPLSPQMSLSEAFRRIARSCLSQVLAASETLQRNRGTEGVHQTRVGLRRLRTALKIFRPAVQDARIDWIEHEARWAAAELGDARALDVFYAESYQAKATTIGDAKAAARYGEHILAARKMAYERALLAVASERFSRLMLEAAIWVESGEWRRARPELLASPIGIFAAEALSSLRRTVRKRGADLADLDADRRHKLRLRTKRLRYATQFFELAFGDEGVKRRRRFVRALKALQDSLGRLNDIALAEGVAVQTLNGTKAPMAAFAAGQIVGGVKAEEPGAIDEAADAFDRFAGAKRYWRKDPGIRS